jgi:hypothetical protein
VCVCVSDPVTSQIIDSGQYTFNIFFLFLFSFILYLPPSFFFSLSLLSSSPFILSDIILYYESLCNDLSLLASFFPFPSILPLELVYFSSSSVQCLFHTCFMHSYTSFATFHTNVPRFSKALQSLSHYSFTQLLRSLHCIISIAFQRGFSTACVLMLHVSSASNFSFP